MSPEECSWTEGLRAKGLFCCAFSGSFGRSAGRRQERGRGVGQIVLGELARLRLEQPERREGAQPGEERAAAAVARSAPARGRARLVRVRALAVSSWRMGRAVLAGWCAAASVSAPNSAPIMLPCNRNICKEATMSRSRQRGIGSSRSPPVPHEPVGGNSRPRKASAGVRQHLGQVRRWAGRSEERLARTVLGHARGYGWRRNGDAQAWGELWTQGSENEFRRFFMRLADFSGWRAGEFFGISPNFPVAGANFPAAGRVDGMRHNATLLQHR